RHTRFSRDWSSDVCSSDLNPIADAVGQVLGTVVGGLQSIDPISDEERALIAVSESLSVDSQRGSTALELSMEADSPLLAQTILRVEEGRVGDVGRIEGGE